MKVCKMFKLVQIYKVFESVYYSFKIKKQHMYEYFLTFHKIGICYYIILFYIAINNIFINPL